MNYKYPVLGISLLLNLLLVWNLIWGEQGLISYKSLQQEFLLLDERIESLEQQNIALSREIRLLQTDDKYIEQMIRRRLNFIKENEVWYIFPDSRAKSAGESLNETKN